MRDIEPFDAILLAGGRGTRLGGTDKPTLRFAGRSLLARSLDAVARARRVAVVRTVGELPADVVLGAGAIPVPEPEAFAGPASAIAAGLDALPVSAPDPALWRVTRRTDDAGGRIVVLACDLLRPAEAVARLLRAESMTHRPGRRDLVSRDRTSPIGAVRDGAIAVDPDGRSQPLLAVYRSTALRDAVARIRGDGAGVRNLAVSRLIDGLALRQVPLDARLCADVDVLADAARAGIRIEEVIRAAP